MDSMEFEMEEGPAEEMEEGCRCYEQVDAIVLKRLKFILKIIKAKMAQPYKKNRNDAHVYFMEIIDAISDWSGGASEEMSMEVVDQQIFPQVCLFITTFTPVEFDGLQRLLLKYITVKWKETYSEAVLIFIADIYGFIVRIAPKGIVEEYLKVFRREEMPPHVKRAILPSILYNAHLD